MAAASFDDDEFHVEKPAALDNCILTMAQRVYTLRGRHQRSDWANSCAIATWPMASTPCTSG
jgi:hypothetical protein